MKKVKTLRKVTKTAVTKRPTGKPVEKLSTKIMKKIDEKLFRPRRQALSKKNEVIKTKNKLSVYKVSTKKTASKTPRTPKVEPKV